MIYTYQQAEEFLNSFIKPPEVVTHPETFLDRFKVFLKFLGNPHQTFPSIIVSGTSGKGSTSFIISSLLTHAGYKTGYTQSPHIERITERLQINGKEMSEKEFIDMVNEIAPIIQSMETTDYGSPSYYEILLAMAFLYFAKERVDVAVVEVGLEGKYDGTNVLDPVVFVLTNISLDHTNILGDTIEKIADEATYKIKNLQLQVKSDQQPIVVSGVTQPEVMQLVTKRAEESHAKLFLLHKEFEYVLKKSSAKGVAFDYIDKTNSSQSLANITVSLLGDYQSENAVLAIKTVLQLHDFGVKVSEETIRETLTHLFYPGRFEIQDIKVKNVNVKIILDGAHNSAKMHAFLSSLEKLFPKKKKIFVTAFSQGHDVSDMLSQIQLAADTIILTQYGVVTDMGKKRSVRLEQLKNAMPQQQKVYIEESAEKAMGKALDMQKDLIEQQGKLQEESLLVVTGSLYLVGEVRQWLHRLNSLGQTD